MTALYSVGENTATTLVGTYTYDAWGKLIAATKAAETSDPDGMLERNPFRYRGYYWDRETGFYYLNSRYYDPEVRRFINADSAIYPRTGLLGQNLFVYCNDDPVNFADEYGQFLRPATRETTKAPELKAVTSASATVSFVEAVNEAVNYLKPVINTIASLPMLDGPLPIGEAVAAVAIAVVAVGVVSYAAIKSASTTKAKDVAASMPKTNNKDVYFPENPYDFAPKGLVFMGPYETFNGKIIKWNYQGVIEIFEWDEDKKEGPHYHVGGHDNTHYYAGDKVPELYASVFF